MGDKIKDINEGFVILNLKQESENFYTAVEHDKQTVGKMRELFNAFRRDITGKFIPYDLFPWKSQGVAGILKTDAYSLTI